MTLTAAGAVWSAACLLDPRLALPVWPGLLLAALGAWAARREETTSRTPLLLALLAVLWAGAARAPINLGADSRSYFAYLPSLAFDRDLDFGDEFAEWGVPDLSPDNPLRRGWHPVGPALLWAPAFALAHAYVRVGEAFGREGYLADGFAAPYVRSAALVTIAVAALGGLFLFQALRRRTDGGTAAVAVLGTVAASTIPYYLFVQPLMGHGIVFGVAAALVFALERAEAEPTRGRWLAAGAVFGLLVLCRWQALVAGALVGSVALAALVRKQVSPKTLLPGAAAALLTFSPQLLFWKLQHGSWLTVPQGAGYVDWSSPHLLDVLVSADHGLLSWTPVAALGVVGLLGLLRRRPAWAAGALVTVLLTAWVNGGVSDWAGSDAYGARRFDFVVPLFAVGVAGVVCATAAAAARRPLAVPALALFALAAWNFGLVRLRARAEIVEAAPLARVAAAQVTHLQRAAERVLGRVAGARGRNLAYKLFVGEYLYENLGLGGTIDLGRPDARFLGSGWSNPRFREDGPRFRWALAPRSCFVLPLQLRTDLEAALTARAPRRLQDQTVEVHLNRRVIASSRLSAEWEEVRFTLPGEALVPGENALCLVFARAWGEEGQQVAAQVARLQLP